MARKAKHPLMLDGKTWDREEVLRIVCEQISCSTDSIGRVLQNGWEGQTLPRYSTFMLWLEESPVFSERYAKAKQAQAEYMVSELLEIADDGRNDWIERNDPSNPGYRVNGEHINRSRLRVDTRKWVAAKLMPKVYGEKLETTHKFDNLDQVLGAIDGKTAGLPDKA